MRKWIIAAVLISFSPRAYSWGFLGHKTINETAVFTVPKPLFGFYKYHVNYIKEHAPDADKRRYLIEHEACRHYLDGDHYERRLPLDTIPKYFKMAIAKYGEDTVLAHGIVPWHISAVMYQLTEAFKAKDIQRILKLSADLGHYVGDCHVPLHSTSNYNGQKTGQNGIHALWESRLPEIHSQRYNLFTGLSGYYEKPIDSIWKAFSESYRLVDSVLLLEKELRTIYDESATFTWEVRGNTVVKVYSLKFCNAYNDALNSMVERRMKAAILCLGSLWYTCWVDAGQPDLPQMPFIPSKDELPGDVPSEKKMIGRPEE